MEPREGHYDFGLFDRAIETLGRHGIKTISWHPHRRAAGMAPHKYPEVLDVSETGQPVNDQSRRQYCYNSPVYRQFSRKIVEALARHYRDNTNIIGWQIDSEMNNENPNVSAKVAASRSASWLQQKYGTLDELCPR